MGNPSDTIVAQATPSGRGGVAIVRVSGPLVKNIISKILGCELIPRKATLLPFLNSDGEILDEGVAIYFPNPHSFTGEDILELHGHGAPIIVDLLLQQILNLGARIASPGEFSERAFLNGKMDLTQAEAIADLIDASSKQAARSAMRSLQGDFSKNIRVLNEKIISLRIYVEAAIDFAQEEIDFLADATITKELTTILTELVDIQNKAKQGSLLREGIQVVIIGEPNVGKSSLLNCLSGKDIAIVTDIPGTTRDVLRESILIDGMPLHVLDTAGLRESKDIVEQEGIRRAHQEIAKADLILHVMDVTKATAITLNNDVPIIYIQNKIDLLKKPAAIQIENNQITVFLSAVEGLGIDLLKEAIKSQVGLQTEMEGLFLARRRHLDALLRAQNHVQASYHELYDLKRGELAAEELRLAQLALCEITGEFTPDDLLGRIFASFCIGK